MKKTIYSILFTSVAALASGQVAIGKESINGTSTILDFYDAADNFRGIILPAVDTKDNALASTNSANNGTFLFDKSDSKMKMYENGAWVDLSGTGDTSQIVSNTSAEGIQEHGVIIGSDTSPAKGVLVLESVDKAVILPKIANPHSSVKSPYPGMICYDTASKTLAVFDGNVWNYWK